MYTIVGIDEAGRGPLAGPISVAAVVATANRKQILNSKYLIHNSLKGIRDSKKFSAKQRGEWLEVLNNNFEYKVAMVGPQVIDKIGIQRATRLAIARTLRRLPKKPDLVLLDGRLKAPKNYNQKTIIKGDEKIPIISAASIVAKVYRDKKMQRLHKIYSDYYFDCHKGYGTKLHYKMIKKHGTSTLHRQSYLKNLNKK
ncbi:ribonuclease HII [Patescibacteria group bacterium]